MPKYYCDYCDTYLTHDSPSVRKTHCQGRKHKENVKFYYQKWMEEQAQHLIDATTAAFRAGKIPSNPFAAGKGAAIPPPNTQIPPPMGQRPPMPPPGMLQPGGPRPPMAPGPMGGMPPGMVMAPGMPPMMPGMRPPMGPMGPMMHMPPMPMGQMGAVRPPPLMGSALNQPMKKP